MCGNYSRAETTWGNIIFKVAMKLPNQGHEKQVKRATYYNTQCTGEQRLFSDAIGNI